MTDEVLSPLESTQHSRPQRSRLHHLKSKLATSCCRQFKGTCLTWQEQRLTPPWTCGQWVPWPSRSSRGGPTSAGRPAARATSSACCWASSPFPARARLPSGTASGSLLPSAWCRTFSGGCQASALPSMRYSTQLITFIVLGASRGQQTVSVKKKSVMFDARHSMQTCIHACTLSHTWRFAGLHAWGHCLVGAW